MTALTSHPPNTPSVAITNIHSLVNRTCAEKVFVQRYIFLAAAAVVELQLCGHRLAALLQQGTHAG